MRMNRLSLYSALCLMALALPAALPSCITTERVQLGFDRPVYVVAPPEDVDRLFIVEQTGKIKVMDLGTKTVSTFLDLDAVVLDTGNEQGLLGLAFSPQYFFDGLFYVNYTQKPDGATRIVEYKVSTGNANQADPASARPILTIPQPQTNHNGGWMEFGLDNQLYISTGDGGGSYDDDTGHTVGVGNAQDIDQNLLGKILRINPFFDDFPGDPNRNYMIPLNNPFRNIPGDDEIWCYGLRNPWRCSFDRQTHDFWIGDVGQGDREEIDFQPVSSTGGENYGWRLREGSIETPQAGIGGPKPPGNVDPLYDYSHGPGTFQGSSVTGGYVYRGPILELQGKYFFGDYVNQKIWSLTRSGSTFTDLTDWTAQFQPSQGNINGISSFGEDGLGNLYIVDLDGELFRIVESSPFGRTTQTVAQPPQKKAAPAAKAVEPAPKAAPAKGRQ
jgi:glucose/arabinose dehydrogenase